MKTHTEETRLTLLSHTPVPHTRKHHAGQRPSESEGNQDQDSVSGTGWGGTPWVWTSARGPSGPPQGRSSSTDPAGADRKGVERHHL